MDIPVGFRLQLLIGAEVADPWSWGDGRELGQLCGADSTQLRAIFPGPFNFLFEDEISEVG
jgi:hypothetical protein